MGVISAIASRNYIAVNKILAREIGLNEAIMIGELASEHEYWEREGKIEPDGYFFSTVKNVEDNTTLSERQQRSVIDKLKKLGILEVALRGLPARRYFKINEEVILTYLTNSYSKNAGGSSDILQELNPAKERSNNNNTINIRNKNKEVYKDIVEFLNSTASTAYRSTTSKTQSLINARLSEGFTVEDFKTVIRKKCAEWKGSNMEKYLRPETLFGTKFESYLNAPIHSTAANGRRIDESKDDLDDLF